MIDSWRDCSGVKRYNTLHGCFEVSLDHLLLHGHRAAKRKKYKAVLKGPTPSQACIR